MAEDVVASRSNGQGTARPAPAVRSAPSRPSVGVRPAIANTAPRRVGAFANRDLHRNYPAIAQPVRRESLAMNFQNQLRNRQVKQQPEQPERARKVNVPPRNIQNAASNRNSYSDALRRCRHERHDCNWWKRHCRTIVFVNTGYYYLDAGYWYPAYGYDPAYSSYDYDGPIYTYGDLLPDQVVANVQIALREAGYYVGPVTGSLGPATRAALANFQRDYGLVITGAIDEPTVQSLGLI
jgi:hypothetical protein